VIVAASYFAQFFNPARFALLGAVVDAPDMPRASSLTLTLGVIVATLGAGAINALNVFFVPHNLHVAASWLGTLTAGEGAGAIAGALVAGWLGRGSVRSGSSGRA